MREALERDLRLLRTEFIRMLSIAKQELELAARVLLEGRTELTEEVHALDQTMDELELKLEAECLRVIAKHQPVARDLRFVAAILKSLADLERVGDYAVHVADDATILASEPPLKRYASLAQMIKRLLEMLETTSHAFAERDASEARDAAGMDLEIDDLFEQIQRELMTYMIEDPRTLSKGLALLRIGRSLQRIGDHIENVSERVDFWVTGSRGSKEGSKERFEPHDDMGSPS